MRKFIAVFAASWLIVFLKSPVLAQTATAPPATSSATVITPIPTQEPVPTSRPDITQKSEETVGPLEMLLNGQNPGSKVFNPLKHALRASVNAGVPANTLVLILLIPVVTTFIAGARHLVGIRGFGIFLPAALSVVFLAIGPIVGIIMFLTIVATTTMARFVLKKSKMKLQYLPRMSLLLLFGVFGVIAVLFLAPVIRHPDLTNVSIFPVLILILLAEDFSKVQLGKSAKVAVNLTTETLILALISYAFLILKPVQEFVLLHPEGLIFGIIIVNIFLGKYIGLRFIEFWRFRRLISG